MSERFGGRKKVSLKTIRELVESGAIKATTVEGNEADFSFYGNVKIEVPNIDIPPAAQPIKIDDTEHTPNQLEHFGDGVVFVAARLLCHELFKKDTHRYFLHAAKMITNQNLKSCPKVMTADQFEIRVGETLVKFGIQAALDEATVLLKTTSAYVEAKESVNDKS
jgi:hypothetical protein